MRRLEDRRATLTAEDSRRTETAVMSTAGPPETVRWSGADGLLAEITKLAPALAKAGRAWVLAYADHAVALGYAQATGVTMAPGKDDVLEPDLLLELRLFGSEGEWHVWREGDAFRARLRMDGSGESLGCIDEDQALLGTKAKAAEAGWTLLEEERGARISVPIKGLKDTDLPLRLHVRHYLHVDPNTHLTGIIDSRLIELCDSERRPLEIAYA